MKSYRATSPSSFSLWVVDHDSDDKNNKDNEEDKKSEYRSYLDESYLEERK